MKIRVSNCNLNIEKGRYLKWPIEQRICQLCHADVEDEFHFLMNCDKLYLEIFLILYLLLLLCQM